MSTLNMVQLIGRLGADPEVRYTPSGTASANFRLATAWKPKDGEERTEWHNVACFGKQAELAGQYLSKGARVYLQGRLQTRKWKDRDGNDRWTTEIVVSRLVFLEPRVKEEARREPPPRQQEVPEDFDDDIPF